MDVDYFQASSNYGNVEIDHSFIRVVADDNSLSDYEVKRAHNFACRGTGQDYYDHLKDYFLS